MVIVLIFSDTQWPSLHPETTPINIFPGDESKRIRTINIRSKIQSSNNNISYYAKFDIIDSACFNPMLSIYFQDTDFDGVGGTEFLNIYVDDILIANCGSNDDTCGDYKYCLDNFTLLQSPSEYFEEGGQLVVHLEKGKDSNVPSGCDYSLWADVTLQCHNGTSQTSNPTSIPTEEPSPQPSMAPTARSTSLVFSDAMEPTSAPLWINSCCTKQTSDNCDSNRCILIRTSDPAPANLTRYSISTQGYQNLRLQFSIIGHYNSQSRCRVLYSVDGGFDFYEIADIPGTSTLYADEERYLDSIANNVNSLAIRISSYSQGLGTDLRFCYVDEVYLYGTTMPTAAPTIPTIAPTTTPKCSLYVYRSDNFGGTEVTYLSTKNAFFETGHKHATDT